jgi:type IV pilus assembly protein PilB
MIRRISRAIVHFQVMSAVDTANSGIQFYVALPGLGRALILAGKLGQKSAEDIYRKASTARTSFIAELTGSGAVSAFDLAHTMSSAFAAPLVDLDAIDAQRLPKGLLDAKICQSYRVIVLSKRNNRLTVATADPVRSGGCREDQVRHPARVSTGSLPNTTSCSSWWMPIPPLPPKRWRTSSAASSSSTKPPPMRSATTNQTAIVSEVEDAPVVKFLHKMLLDAFSMRASDLHFEPYEHTYRVRFRIDGELREIAAPPIAIKDKLASRIKVISKMDISEKRVPQDGKMKLKVGPNRVIDFRVSTLPTLFGEKIVIRILDPSSAKLGVDALGYEPEEKERLLDAIGRPYGMILVTGPTGSGKTVSLYTCLNLLNKPGVNIATAEDPSEINLPGVNQVNVNEKAGLTFAAALKSFLRQDPDIIMVGEIRDLETADIAIKAAQTGHLVLSTLHTNDAPTTLTRMRNMGIAPFNIASSVILITAQRLARRLCTNCKAPVDVPEKALLDAGFKAGELDGTWVTYRPVGCSVLQQRLQRAGRHLPGDARQRRNPAHHPARRQRPGYCRTGHQGRRRLPATFGPAQSQTGLTSLEEVLAVTNE